jgi:hypothetical protein
MKLVWSKFAKIKKIQKIPAQKSPDRFSSMDKQSLADKAARRKFGEGSDFLTKQGMQTKSIRDVAVKDYATKVENKMFFKTLNKELKSSRIKTAGGIKGLKAKGTKVPKASIFKAKTKGAVKSYNKANVTSKAAFTKITERYTGRAKASIFKKSSKAPSKKPYSLETREVQFLKKLKEDMGF